MRSIIHTIAQRFTTRFRLASLVAGITLVVVLLTGATFTWATIWTVNNQFRTQAEQLAETINMYGVESDQAQAELLAAGAAVVLYDATGNITASYGSDHLIAESQHELSEYAGSGSEYSDVLFGVASGGDPVHTSALEAGEHNFTTYTFALTDAKHVSEVPYQVAQVLVHTNQLQQVITAGVVVFVGSIVLATALSFAAGWVVSRRALRPAYELASSMRQVDTQQIATVAALGNKKDVFVQLTTEYNAMLERLEEGMQRQKEFVANASHELKTPITRAVSTIDVIDLPAGQAHDQLQAVQEDLMRMSTLVEDLLMLANLNSLDATSNVLTREKDTVHLRSTILDIVYTFQPEIEEQGITIDVQIVDDIMVTVSEGHFKILLSNLISNAVKYNQTNGEIRLTAKQQKNSITLEIWNTGFGFSASEKEMLLDRFYRTSSGQDMATGNGLGLTIVQRIAEQAGYALEISSEEAKWAEFIVKGIPANKS